MASRCAAPVERQIEAATICFSSEAVGHGFSVRLTCHATRSLEFVRRRGQRRRDVHTQRYRGDKLERTFPVHDPEELRSGESCRAALRRMMMELPQLQSLELSEDEWDAVVPGDDVVPQIVGVASGSTDDDGAATAGSSGHTFCLTVSVRRRVIHSEEALLMACKERAAESDMDASCAVCLDDLAGESALELPGCAHAFHRRCISVWFSKAATCPMCRADVRLCVLREFLALSNQEQCQR